MKAVIYCSASFDIDPEYNEIARDLVKALCRQGYDIVTGGTVKGTMKVVADTARDCGVKNVGILPRFMKEFGYPDLTELVWTDTMAERKELMREGTSLAVALPGGIGTLEELVETLTLAKLGRYEGKVLALNHKGFYEPLRALLDHYVATGMLDARSRELICFADTVEEAMAYVNS